VARVAWHEDVVVLVQVVFYEGCTRLLAFALLEGAACCLRYWQEALVAWDVLGHLRAAEFQLVFYLWLFQAL
jgi:hypothetical protein